MNLVFFKPVNSHTKFWQMVGRGTRLRPDLYGPGDDKRDFVIFDVCSNIDFFNEELPEAPASRSLSLSLSERTFLQRTRLLAALNGIVATDAASLRAAIAGRLRRAVAGMNRDNFLVRRHLRAVERFGGADAWDRFGPADLEDAAELAGLPSAAEQDADEAAKRFDALILDAQVAVATGEPVPAGVASRIAGIAQALGDQRSIPAVAAQAALLDALVDPTWWDDVEVVRLERVRVHLRDLVRLIGRESQAIVYSDFEDTLDPARDVVLTRVVPGLNRRAFREKLFGFLSGRSDVLRRRVGCRAAARRSRRRGRSRPAGPLDRRHGALGRRRGAHRFRLDAGLHPPPARVRRPGRAAAHDRRPTRPATTLRRPLRRDRTEGPDEIFSDAQVTDLIARIRRFDEIADPSDEHATA